MSSHLNKSLSVIAIAAAALASQAALASPITASSTGLTAAHTTITFDEQVLAAGATVTNQFAPQGLTVSPNLYYTPQTSFPNIAGNDLGNFPATGGTGSLITAFTLTFSTTQSGAAFAMVSNSSSWFFEALLGGVTQESFTAAVGSSSSSNFYGFSGLAFNAIRVSGSDNMLLDNLQLTDTGAVPEPSSLALAGVAILGLGAASRKRSQKR
jgi:hypothetical protein